MTPDTIQEAPKDSLRGYVLVFAALVALTLGTWGFSFLHLGDWSVLVALAFAVAKGSLVGWFFMHLSHERATSRLAIGTALVFVGLLCALVLSDIATRLPPTLPGGNGELRLGESPRPVRTGAAR